MFSCNALCICKFMLCFSMSVKDIIHLLMALHKSGLMVHSLVQYPCWTGNSSNLQAPGAIAQPIKNVTSFIFNKLHYNPSVFQCVVACGLPLSLDGKVMRVLQGQKKGRGRGRSEVGAPVSASVIWCPLWFC